jgi:repressor LexA
LNDEENILNRIESLKGKQSLVDFCKDYGLNYPAMQKSISRRRAPGSATLEKIARHSGVNLQWLVAGEVDKTKLSKTVVKNIVFFRKNKGWSRVQLAEKMGLSMTVYDLIENGAWPLSTKEISALARALDVLPQYFFITEQQHAPVPELKVFKSTSSRTTPKISAEDYVSIPLTDSFIAAGQPIIQEDNVEDYVLLHIRAAGKRSNLVASRVDGQSMEPMLHSGDIVVIDRDDKSIQKNKIFAIYYQEGLTAKYLEVHKELLILRPINPISEVQIINLAEEPDPIVGRIIGAWKEL